MLINSVWRLCSVYELPGVCLLVQDHVDRLHAAVESGNLLEVHNLLHYHGDGEEDFVTCLAGSRRKVKVIYIYKMNKQEITTTTKQ